MTIRSDASAPPAEPVDWQQRLHWIVRSLDTGDRDLSFIASLLHQSLDRPGLTERQAKWAQRIFDRTVDEWLELGSPSARGADLAGLPIAGSA